MSLVTVGSLVLCMILQPTKTTNSNGEEVQDIQKKPGIIKQIFYKKVLKDTPNRLAIHEDKEMFIIETLDGEAEITIGSDACKRVVEPKEYREFLKLKEKYEKGEVLSSQDKIEDIEDSKDSPKKEEIKIEKEIQSKEQKNKLLRELDN